MASAAVDRRIYFTALTLLIVAIELACLHENANAVPTAQSQGNVSTNGNGMPYSAGNAQQIISVVNNDANNVEQNVEMPSAALPAFPELNEQQKAMAVRGLKLLLNALRKNKDLSWMALVIEVLLEAYTPLSQLYAAFKKDVEGVKSAKKELAFFGQIRSLFQRAMPTTGPNGQNKQHVKEAIENFLKNEPEERAELYKFVLEFVTNNYEAHLDEAVAQLRQLWIQRLRPSLEAFRHDWQKGINQAEGLPPDQPLDMWRNVHFLAGAE